MSWSAVDALDGPMDRVLGRWRGNPVADGLAYGASALGDHGLVWFLIGVARSRPAGPGRARAAWAIAFSGTVTPAVNQALKRSVGRGRPERDESDPRTVRVPRSTSFPSGHALAAWCAATLLATDDPLGPAYYLVAAMVSASRVHLRQHHPTDVLAGAVLGTGLGRLGRKLEPARFRVRPGSGMGAGRKGLDRS